METRWTLQCSMGRALEIANLEDAEKLDNEKDKSLSDIVTAIEMIKAGETTMRKFHIKHARAVSSFFCHELEEGCVEEGFA